MKEEILFENFSELTLVLALSVDCTTSIYIFLQTPMGVCGGLPKGLRPFGGSLGAEAERRQWRSKRSEGPVSKGAQARLGECDHCELWA